MVETFQGELCAKRHRCPRYSLTGECVECSIVQYGKWFASIGTRTTPRIDARILPKLYREPDPAARILREVNSHARMIGLPANHTSIEIPELCPYRNQPMELPVPIFFGLGDFVIVSEIVRWKYIHDDSQVIAWVRRQAQNRP